MYSKTISEPPDIVPDILQLLGTCSQNECFSIKSPYDAQPSRTSRMVRYRSGAMPSAHATAITVSLPCRTQHKQRVHCRAFVDPPSPAAKRHSERGRSPMQNISFGLGPRAATIRTLEIQTQAITRRIHRYHAAQPRLGSGFLSLRRTSLKPGIPLRPPSSRGAEAVQDSTVARC
jgi:hypothetical protein